ncbi:FUSC family protein [Francisella halioticida]|nr:FUSC family protein [Francisella halioticida]
MKLLKIRFNLSDTTLLSIRVLIATALGLSFSYMLFTLIGQDEFLVRIYWVVIAIVSVSVSSSTNVIYTRAKYIIMFCILGTSFGSAILFLIQKDIHGDFYFLIVAILCIVGLCLNMYTAFLNYATSVFFIHIYIVMFFGLLESWNKYTFLARILCILIGTSSIVLVTYITRGSKFLHIVVKEMEESYLRLKNIVSNIDKTISNREIMPLIERSIKLNDLLYDAKYEFLSKENYRECKRVLLLMDELLLSLRSYRVLDLKKENYVPDLYNDMNEYTREKIKRNFKQITVRYQRLTHKD